MTQEKLPHRKELCLQSGNLLLQVLFCSPPDCRQGAWKECGKYEEENAFRYQRLIDCPVLSGGENVITDSSCSTRSGQNSSYGNTGSKVFGVSVLYKP